VAAFIKKHKNPSLKEYTEHLILLDEVGEGVLLMPDSFSIGAICLKNEIIKNTINETIMNIKKKMIHNLHEMCKSSLETQFESIKNQSMQIDRESDSTETLVNIMSEIKSVRSRE
jgi:hypothetical protein